MRGHETALKVPINCIPMTHAEMELTEGGGTLTVRVSASALRLGSNYYKQAIPAVIGNALKGAHVSSGTIRSVTLVVLVAAAVWSRERTRTNHTLKLDIRTLRKNMTVSI